MAMSMAGFSIAIMKPALSNSHTSLLEVPVCVRHGLAPLKEIDSDVPPTFALHVNMNDCASGEICTLFGLISASCEVAVRQTLMPCKSQSCIHVPIPLR